MKLQIALDGELQESLSILQAVYAFVDIAEIGTPLIFREGMSAVRHLRRAFPTLPLLADLKIMDAGEEEASIAFAAGCQLVTVLGVTQEATLRGALTAARRFGGQIMVDMMQVPDPIPQARQFLAMGCHHLCVHTAHDLQGTQNPLALLQQLRQELPKASLAVAGGISPKTIHAVAALQPDIIIVGGAITGAAKPAQVARTIRERMQAHESV